MESISIEYKLDAETSEVLSWIFMDIVQELCSKCGSSEGPSMGFTVKCAWTIFVVEPRVDVFNWSNFGVVELTVLACDVDAMMGTVFGCLDDADDSDADAVDRI